MTDARVRRAGPGDAAELVRLRALMFTSMGIDVGGPGAAWLARSQEHLRGRLADTARFAAYVVDGAGGTLAASAIGWLDEHLSGLLMNPDVGHIANISTDVSRRREGLARACLEALLAWLRGTGVNRIDLNATAEGEPLYRSLGFLPPAYPTMTLVLRSP